MADVVVVGDGPGGLSAALFLARNGLSVEVFGKDQTAMHAAHLFNFLGFPEIRGPEYQRIARGQVERAGAILHDALVSSIVRVGDAFAVHAADTVTPARYLVLSEGKNPVLARSLGLAEGPRGIAVDLEGRTSLDRVYAVGRMVRPDRSQAAVSVGNGASAALDILAREKGQEGFVDWDMIP